MPASSSPLPAIAAGRTPAAARPYAPPTGRNRRLLERAFASFALGVAGMALAWTTAAQLESPLLAGALACILVATATGAGTLAGATARLPVGAYELFTAALTVMLTAVFLATHPERGLPMVLLHLWAAPYVFWFFPLRRALASAALTAACYGLCLTAVDAPGPPRDALVRWLLLAGALAGTAALMRGLRASLQHEREESERQLALREELADAAAAEDAALLRVATAVAAEGEPRDVFALVARELASLFGAEHAAVIRFGAVDVTVEAAWTRGSPTDLVPGTRLAVEPGGPVDQLRRDDRPLRMVMPRADARLPFRLRIAAPVHVAGGVWGMVVLGTNDEDAFERLEEARLTRFAALISLAVANSDARMRLAELAFTDSLTGLANHRRLQERLVEDVQRARREGTPLSLVVFDLDQFKEINDAHGHQAGDEVLAAIAERLGRGARPGELLARVGGDEFALLLPGVDGAEAARIAEQRRRAVGDRPVGEYGRLTLSAGSCDLAQAADDTDLVRLADRALYWAKGHGRDQSVAMTAGRRDGLGDVREATTLAQLSTLRALRALARAVDAKDPSTQRHSERVAALSVELAAELGWSPARRALLRDAALIHDVGKIGVPDAILLKPARLTPAERAVVNQHAALGAQIAAEVLGPEQAGWIRHHHERVDGAGYPDGLAGDAIADGARLIALADSWDVMTSARPYSAALSTQAALAECRRCAGAQFAPEAVAALERLAAAGVLDRRDDEGELRLAA